MKNGKKLHSTRVSTQQRRTQQTFTFNRDGRINKENSE